MSDPIAPQMPPQGSTPGQIPAPMPAPAPMPGQIPAPVYPQGMPQPVQQQTIQAGPAQSQYQMPQGQPMPQPQPYIPQPVGQIPAPVGIPGQPVIVTQKVAPSQTVKKGSNLSFGGILIGCGVFLMLVIGGGTFALYNVIQNPSELKSLGLPISQAKTILQIFAALFFGFLFFAGFGVAIMNGYRMLNKKAATGSKIGNVLGIIAGVLVIGAAVGFGSTTLTAINAIKGEQTAISNNIILPSYITKEGPQLVLDATSKLIAPGNVTFGLNTTTFNSTVLTQLGGGTLDSMKLDCGNGQTLPVSVTNGAIAGTCLYITKGDYNFILTVTTKDKTTGKTTDKAFPAGSIHFWGEIDLTVNGKALTLNDGKTELLAGNTPAKVSMDATTLFSDYNLKNFKISRDIDNDGKVDFTDQSSITPEFFDAKLDTVAVSIPELSNRTYLFNLRLNQGDVPLCTVNTNQTAGTSYTSTITFSDNKKKIDEYLYEVIDATTDKTLTTSKSGKPNFDYTFPQSGSYKIRTTFATDDGKQGSCTSDIIDVGAVAYNITDELRAKSPNAPQYSKLSTTGTVVTINELPTLLERRITGITPRGADTNVIVTLDDKPIIASKPDTYDTTIADATDHVLKIAVTSAKTNKGTTKIINIRVQQAGVLGVLKASPNTVGTDPFEVTLDASQSVATKAGDEIIYFTWDFGDGNQLINVSDALIKHTYTYDSTKQNGTYNPTVTITTKKGEKLVVPLDSPILVKQAVKKVSLLSSTNPSQQAGIGDRVSYTLDYDGDAKNVDRDFGNGKTLKGCSGRMCNDQTTTYTAAGDYTVKATVTFDDNSMTDTSMKMKIQ